MVNYTTAFPSKFLKAADLDSEEPVFTIKSFRTELVAEGEPSKPVLYFEEVAKGLVLNKTNGRIIERIVGSPETDEWIGKKIQLYTAMVEFKGDMVEAIRIKLPPKKNAPPAEHLDDDIPF